MNYYNRSKFSTISSVYFNNNSSSIYARNKSKTTTRNSNHFIYSLPNLSTTNLSNNNSKINKSNMGNCEGGYNHKLMELIDKFVNKLSLKSPNLSTNIL